mmetsp:Transcript_11506/g.13128  ORF Transcript_11506/g.13128 Transcript_11506/m.13128 type:complete len:173 (+) Transcript_11506:23-541(+)
MENKLHQSKGQSNITMKIAKVGLLLSSLVAKANSELLCMKVEEGTQTNKSVSLSRTAGFVPTKTDADFKRSEQIFPDFLTTGEEGEGTCHGLDGTRFITKSEEGNPDGFVAYIPPNFALQFHSEQWSCDGFAPRHLFFLFVSILLSFAWRLTHCWNFVWNARRHPCDPEMWS